MAHGHDSAAVTAPKLIEASYEGHPFYLGMRGERVYAYHPHPERILHGY